MKFCNSHLTRYNFNLYMRRFFFGLVYTFSRECYPFSKLIFECFGTLHQGTHSKLFRTSKSSHMMDTSDITFCAFYLNRKKYQFLAGGLFYIFFMHYRGGHVKDLQHIRLHIYSDRNVLISSSIKCSV